MAKAAILYDAIRHQPAGTRSLMPPVGLLPGFEVAGPLVHFARDSEIFAQGAQARALYKIAKGVVRTSRVLDDGRRHIVSFYFPGDLFGMEWGDVAEFSAEAVTDCTVHVVQYSSVFAEMDGSGVSARNLWTVLARELRRTQHHSFLLSRLSATERVWVFLKDVAQRQSGGTTVELPMSRVDIADHLGLTIETVSRTFTQLRRSGFIECIDARRINLRRRESPIAA